MEHGDDEAVAGELLGLVDEGDPAALLAAHPDLADLFEEVLTNARAATSAATQRAYATDWAAFVGWCAGRGVAPLPALPVVVAMYLSHLGRLGRRIATIARALASLASYHRRAGHPSPAADPQVREVWKGLRRRHGAPQTSRQALLTEALKSVVAAAPGGPGGLTALRDRALLLVGWAGAFRRSELVALEVADVEALPTGALRVTVRRSKTDQEGRGFVKVIGRARDPQACPVECLRRWREAAGITAGPLFRPIDRHGHVGRRALTGASVALVVKRAARSAGLDPTRLAGHSLRSGFATSMSMAGAPLPEIMQQTGHRSAQMAMRYVQEADRLRQNHTVRAGL